MWYNKKHPAYNLPDAYDKKPTSNNYKILEIERLEAETLREGLYNIESILDISKATGKTLDYYGERIGQKRGLATDDQYRVLILAKIMRHLSNGSYNSVVECLSKTFNCELDEIQFVDEEETCTISIKTLPVEKISKAGFTQKQALAIIKSMIPICITLNSYYVESTFEFAEDETTYDEDKGFTDVEGGTVGGYFGYLFASDNEPILPI